MTAIARSGSLEEAFREFDDANPQVYSELLRLARQWRRRRGLARAGIKMLWEVARWNFSLRAQSRDPFKLNNDHHAFYARKLMAHHPELAGIFATRGRSGRCVCSQCEGKLF